MVYRCDHPLCSDWLDDITRSLLPREVTRAASLPSDTSECQLCPDANQISRVATHDSRRPQVTSAPAFGSPQHSIPGANARQACEKVPAASVDLARTPLRFPVGLRVRVEAPSGQVLPSGNAGLSKLWTETVD